MLRFLLNFAPKGSLVAVRERVTEYLHLATAVKTRDALHEVRCRVVAEVGGDVANPEPSSAGEQSLGVGVRLTTKAGNLKVKV